VDITRDPSSGNAPVTIPVAICEGTYRPVVIGFGQVDLAADEVTLWVPDWDEVRPLIDNMLVDIDIGDNWWTRG
jgi:hypothetical protein